MKSEKCDHCGELGQLGPEIRAYSFATLKENRNGTKQCVVRFLHASDGGKPCYFRWESKYLAWRNEQQAKAVANG